MYSQKDSDLSPPPYISVEISPQNMFFVQYPFPQVAPKLVIWIYRIVIFKFRFGFLTKLAAKSYSKDWKILILLKNWYFKKNSW